MLGGKRAVAGGQRVSSSRGDLQRGPSISSISCSSSLAFHHQKYFGGVTQPAAAASHSNTRPAALSVPLARDLGRGEPQGSGLRTRRARGGCGASRCQSANRKRAHDCARPLLVLSMRGNDLGDRSSKRVEPRLVAQTDRLRRTIEAKFARRQSELYVAIVSHRAPIFLQTFTLKGRLARRRAIVRADSVQFVDRARVSRTRRVQWQ